MKWSETGPKLTALVDKIERKKRAAKKAEYRADKAKRAESRSSSRPIKKEPQKGLRRIPDDELNDPIPF